MSKIDTAEKQAVALIQHCKEKVKIACSFCKVSVTAETSAVEIVDELAEMGWRSIDGKCACDKCAKKRK